MSAAWGARSIAPGARNSGFLKTVGERENQETCRNADMLQDWEDLLTRGRRFIKALRRRFEV